MAIKAATPMNTPSMVRPARILLRADGAQRSAHRQAQEYPRLQQGCLDDTQRRRFPQRRNRRQRARRLAGRGLSRRQIGDDQAVANRDDSIGQLREHALVRDEHHGHAALAIECPQCREDVGGRCRVEIAGRLVRQHDGRIVHQRTRNGHTLLLAAGELVGLILRAVAEAQQAEHVLGPLRIAGNVRRIEQRQFDVLHRGRARQQIEALKHETDAAAANLRQGRLIQLGDVDPFKQVIARGRHIQATQDVHQGGLARTRGAHDGHELAPPYRETHAAQRMHVDVAQSIGLRRVADEEHRLVGGNGQNRGPAPPC
jgi:hypothetical protein